MLVPRCSADPFLAMLLFRGDLEGHTFPVRCWQVTDRQSTVERAVVVHSGIYVSCNMVLRSSTDLFSTCRHAPGFIRTGAHSASAIVSTETLLCLPSTQLSSPAIDTPYCMPRKVPQLLTIYACWLSLLPHTDLCDCVTLLVLKEGSPT